MTGAPAAIHVVCLGNPWHGDDGFGGHVFRRLRRRTDLPPAVELFDAGVAGLDALPLLDGCIKAVIVDGVRVGAPVGTLHRLLPGDLEPPADEFSLHELGLPSLLAALPALASHPPEVVVIGAQVGRVRAFTETLSAPLQNALPDAVAMVVRECARGDPGGTGGRLPRHHRARAPGGPGGLTRGLPADPDPPRVVAAPRRLRQGRVLTGLE